MNARARGRLAKTMKERSFRGGPQTIVVEGHTGMAFFVITTVRLAVSVGGGPLHAGPASTPARWRRSAANPHRDGTARTP